MKPDGSDLNLKNHLTNDHISNEISTEKNQNLQQTKDSHQSFDPNNSSELKNEHYSEILSGKLTRSLSAVKNAKKVSDDVLTEPEKRSFTVSENQEMGFLGSKSNTNRQVSVQSKKINLNSEENEANSDLNIFSSDVISSSGKSEQANSFSKTNRICQYC